MKKLYRWVLPLAVQVAVVCVILVIGLIPLTAPLPDLSRSAAVIALVSGAFLLAAVAALVAMTLLPRFSHLARTSRILAAAVVGVVSSGALFIAMSGLLTRPLILLAFLSLLIIFGFAGTGWAQRLR